MPVAVTDTLKGVTAIIVEDNMLVADSTRLLLEALDGSVAGLAGTIERGVDLVASAEFDIALLDIDLRGRSITPVVRALESRAKPFLFISGFGDGDVLTEDLRAVERLAKPLDAAHLVAAIHRAISRV